MQVSMLMPIFPTYQQRELRPQQSIHITQVQSGLSVFIGPV